MKVSADFLKKGKKPRIEKWYNQRFLKSDNFISNAILYFGIGFEEIHREGAIRTNWQPFRVEMPLIENVINNDEILKKYQIKQARLYDLQFSHSNCKCRCVKAGQGHFKNLFMKDEQTFTELKEQEIVISDHIQYYRQCKGKDHL